MNTSNCHCCACAERPLLSSKELSPGLPVQACGTCRGHWLRLDDYRHWADLGGVAEVAATDTQVIEHWLSDRVEPARACPCCGRIMERLRTGRQPDIRIDRCVHCQSVWLDGGEWEALQFQQARLDDVLSDMWQRQLRESEAQERRDHQVRQRLGDATVDEMVRIREWLSGQAEPDRVLQLIRNGW